MEMTIGIGETAQTDLGPGVRECNNTEPGIKGYQVLMSGISGIPDRFREIASQSVTGEDNHRRMKTVTFCGMRNQNMKDEWDSCEVGFLIMQIPKQTQVTNETSSG